MDLLFYLPPNLDAALVLRSTGEPENGRVVAWVQCPPQETLQPPPLSAIHSVPRQLPHAELNKAGSFIRAAAS